MEQIADAPEEDTTTDVLASIEQIEDAPKEDTTSDVLANIEQVEDAAKENNERADAILAGIDVPQETAEPEDALGDVLNSIQALPEAEVRDDTDDVLAQLEKTAPQVQDPVDDLDDILSGIESVQDDVEEADQTSDVLAGLEAAPEPEQADDLDGILSGLDTPIPEAEDTDDVTDVLSSLEPAPQNAEVDDLDDILSGIDVPDTAPQEGFDDILSGLETTEDAPEPEDTTDDVLAALDTPASEAASGDDLDDILSNLDTATPKEDDNDGVADILAGLEETAAASEDAQDLDDILSNIDTPTPEPESADDVANVLAEIEATLQEPGTDDLEDILSGLDAPDDKAPDDLDDILSGLDTGEGATENPDGDSDDLDDILAGLDTDAADTGDAPDDDMDALLAGLEAPQDDAAGGDDLDDILAGLDSDAADAEDAADDDMDALLAGLEAPQEDAAGGDDLDDILAGLDSDAADTEDAPDDDMDALLAGLEAPQEDAAGGDDLDDILAGLDSDAADTEDAPDDDMDALLAALEAPQEDAAGGDDLDDILAGLDSDAADAEDAPDDDMDALLADLDDGDDDLDALLGDIGGDDDDSASSDTGTDDTEAGEVEQPAPVQSPFGTISATRPERADLNRNKFRMALFGDFTGRAARGVLETGDALAARAPIALDVDTIDDIIEGFGTTLVLPIGEGGTGVEIKLGEMDDLHPDELYDNVDLFDAIAGVRQQLSVGSMADRAVDQLKSWSETYATPIKLPKRSAGSAMPTNLKLTDFQALIGDTRGTLTQAGPADALIAQIIGPHVVKAPDAGVDSMKAAVDEALSSAMNLILHHPEFQAIEAQWRSLDLLARRIETDVKLEIVLYDISAEELAADLTAHEDLADSGLFRLVTDVLEPEEGAGGFSAMFGLYTFEETPPHAELLARIGTVAAHVDAPFFSAISPNYLDTAPEDRHPLVAENWDMLRSLPEASYVALASPRFMLRQPYGAKSDPVYAFNFEEFSPREGLKGMLWANPAILIAVLLAGTYKKDGKAMDLGSLMALGDLPFFYVNDRYGDQVALPCTERNLTSDPVQATLGRGYMPVVWMKGRNEIRLGSFRSLGGDVIAGPWEAEVPAPRPAPGAATLETTIPAPQDDADQDDDTSLDDLMSDLEDDTSTDDDTSLDDLLAGFDDDGDDDDASDDDMDPDLAALLEGL
ncbi:type VI secretion system contractile sheath domain-containing protein [Tateyamaria sp.]|uniref:type VI secretion system contractile sheath domain-containing protein n=1 Tax=Tateyamaria sp. TaxID=1929288 RepID=UPI00329C02E4